MATRVRIYYIYNIIQCVCMRLIIHVYEYRYNIIYVRVYICVVTFASSSLIADTDVYEATPTHGGGGGASGDDRNGKRIILIASIIYYNII